MKNILVVAPHPDDETLGCGATILKLIENGATVHWLIVTAISTEHGFSEEKVRTRTQEIEKVNKMYGFNSVIEWEIPTSTIDSVPVAQMVDRVSTLFNTLKPDTIFLPYSNDVHTDHYFTSKAFLSCCKWFRHSYLKNVLFYETLSETNFNINSTDRQFRANLYFDIDKFFNKKIDILKVFSSELGEFPFPRSVEAVEALAKLRGTQCGANKAEAFELLMGIL
jgi:LmbE family N-acetylglucosaminyl deacetylase